MRISIVNDAVSPVLTAAADLLDHASSAFVEGSVLLETTPLDGPDWEDRFHGALSGVAVPWRRGQQALQDARASVAALGAADPRAVTALNALDASMRFLQNGYSYMGDTLNNLPRPLEPKFAALGLARMGGAGRAIAANFVDAATAIRHLVA